MNCPKCRKPLIVAEREGIELDCCPWCRGLWFDSGEMDLLAEKLGLPASEHDPTGFALAATNEKLRCCPRCDGAMEKVYFDASRTILIDRCARGHGLWFDRDELGEALEQFARASGAPAGSVVSFLGESFRR